MNKSSDNDIPRPTVPPKPKRPMPQPGPTYRFNDWAMI